MKMICSKFFEVVMMLKVIQSLQVISFSSRVLLLNKSRVSRETCDKGRLWLAA